MRQRVLIGVVVLLTTLGVLAPLRYEMPPAPAMIPTPVTSDSATVEPTPPFAAFAERHPEAYQRMIEVSRARGWTPTNFATAVG